MKSIIFQTFYQLLCYFSGRQLLPSNFFGSW